MTDEISEAETLVLLLASEGNARARHVVDNDSDLAAYERAVVDAEVLRLIDAARARGGGGLLVFVQALLERTITADIDATTAVSPACVADVVNTLTTAWAQGEETFTKAVSVMLSLEPPSNTAVSMVAGEILAETPVVDPVVKPCGDVYRRAYGDGVRALADALKVPRD